MANYYGLIGIGIAILLTVFAGMWLDYYTKTMKQEEDDYDEYEAEQARLSWEAKKAYGARPNKLTAINAVNKGNG